MRRGAMSRTTKPRYEVAIEWEDENYIYLSSQYTYKKLKPDIEGIKKPITIHFSDQRLSVGD